MGRCGSRAKPVGTVLPPGDQIGGAPLGLQLDPPDLLRDLEMLMELPEWRWQAAAVLGDLAAAAALRAVAAAGTPAASRCMKFVAACCICIPMVCIPIIAMLWHLL